MPALRFNHMELTLAQGALDPATRDDIKRFYADVFEMEALDVPILKQIGLLLRTDPETSQFLLVTETKQPIHSPGFDHLGFLYPSRAEVDERLARVRQWQARDDRVRIKEYADLVTGETTVHAFYVRYLLPIWFDVQCIESPLSEGPRWTWA